MKEVRAQLHRWLQRFQVNRHTFREPRWASRHSKPLVQLVRVCCTVLGATISIATTIAGCARIFGLDEPTLACDGGAECADAIGAQDSHLPALAASDGDNEDTGTNSSLDGADGDDGNAGPDAPRTEGDASGDAETGPAGVRCGPKDASPPYCTIGTVCCGELAADGGISFSCKGINCADSRNCDPLDCCHESGGIFCRPSCPGTLVCDPVERKCQSHTCKVSLSILGESSTAYLGCN